MIQPHGAFVALDPQRDLIVVAASRNTAGLLAASGQEEVIGRTIGSVLGSGFAEAVQRRFLDGGLQGKTPWQSTLRLDDPPSAFDLMVHTHAGLIHVELERTAAPNEPDAHIAVRHLQTALIELREAKSELEELARITTRSMRLLTGYERVLIYRLDPEANGEAICEDKTDDWQDSLSGLHSPASNCPAQARELYRRSPMRWVPDRNAVMVPLDIDPAWVKAQPSPYAIDLSFVRLRSLSPKHLQFHRNMGVNGSLSLSILHEGRLWGLVICHHRQPHHPSTDQLAAAAALTDAFALHVGRAERDAKIKARQNDRVTLSALLAHMAAEAVLIPALTAGPVTINDLFGSAGVAMLYDRKLSLLGRTPSELDIWRLTAWLRTQCGSAKLFQTNNLAAAYPAWAPHVADASGLLVVFLSDDHSDMLLWFRPEQPEVMSWGGNPFMGVIGEPANPQLSFDRWAEPRQGFARRWADWEVEIAESVQHASIEVIVRSLRLAQRVEAAHQSLRMAEEALSLSNEVLQARTQAHQAQQDSEDRFRFATQAGRFGVWELDLQTNELTASAMCKENFGRDQGGAFTYAELQDAVRPEDRARVQAAMEHSIATGTEYEIECRIVRFDGTPGWVQMHARVVHAADGTALRMAGISLNIGERVRIEERIRQSQRVEAVGRLTSGVAHDFNNVLQALLGGLELAIEDLVDQPLVREDLELALQAGQRGARLTSHLLSFARQQDLRPGAMVLSALLADLSSTLKRTLGRDIAVRIEVAPNLPCVLADAAHLDSALLNLALNARDAMPKGGELRIDAYARQGQVVIAVSDNGDGMTPEVLAQACEPFFTTKGVEGSGLGLSMVQGFARQSGGELRIQSAPGQGTRVELWLPTSQQLAMSVPVPEAQQVRGQGRILVVDDDTDVGRVSAAFLHKAGFNVITVKSGDEALVKLGAGNAFDALVTDYAMPGINGVDLVLQARELHATLPALIITGYAGAEGLDRLPSDIQILRKPFQRDHLVENVKGLIESAEAKLPPEAKQTAAKRT